MQPLALRIGILAVAVGALLVLPGAVAEAAFPGTNGLIAFERGADIYTVTTDSAHTVSSSPLVAGASDPAWPANGQRLAFVQGGDVKVLTIGGPTVVVHDGTAPTPPASPAWSPDGAMVVFQESSDIWVVSSAGGGTARNLSFSGVGVDDADPAWSPDGGQIAFTR